MNDLKTKFALELVIALTAGVGAWLIRVCYRVDGAQPLPEEGVTLRNIAVVLMKIVALGCVFAILLSYTPIGNFGFCQNLGSWAWCGGFSESWFTGLVPTVLAILVASLGTGSWPENKLQLAMQHYVLLFYVFIVTSVFVALMIQYILPDLG